MNKNILIIINKPSYDCRTCKFIRETSGNDIFCDLFNKFLERFSRCDDCTKMEKDSELLKILLNENTDDNKTIFVVKINIVNEKYCSLWCTYLLDLSGCARPFDLCSLFDEHILAEKIDKKEFHTRCQKCVDAEKYLTEVAPY